MKTIKFFPFVALSVFFSAFAPTQAVAQGAVDGSVAVNVNANYVTFLGGSSMAVTFPAETSSGVADVILSAVGPTSAPTGSVGYAVQAAPAVLNFTFGRGVPVHVVSTSIDTQGFSVVEFSPPAGYQVFIDGVPKTRWVKVGASPGGTQTADFMVMVSRNYKQPDLVGSGALGEASPILWGAPRSTFGFSAVPRMEFNLGFARNGDPLPPLAVPLADPVTVKDGISSFDHADVDVADLGPNGVRIDSPQLTAFMRPSATQPSPDFAIDFYLPGQTTGAFVSYQVHFTTISGLTRFQTVEVTKTIGAASYVTKLQSDQPGVDSNWGSFDIIGQWTVDDWHRSSDSVLRKITNTRTATPAGGVNPNYSDTLQVKDGTGATVVTSQVIDYRRVQETITLVDQNGVAPVTATNTVYSQQKVTFGTANSFFVQTLLDSSNRAVGVLRSSGRTTVSEFAGSGATLVPLRTYATWKDASPTFDSTTNVTTANNCAITDYIYTNDWNSAPILPTSIRTKVAGTLVAESTTEYASATANGQPILIAKRSDFSAAGSTGNATTPRDPADGPKLQTIAKIYREDTVNRLLVARPYSLESPDGTKQSFVYETGTFTAGATPAFNVNGTGSDFRVTILSGLTSTSTAAGGVSITSLTSASGSVDVDSVVLVPLRSTKSVTILQRGLPVRREVSVFVSGPSTSPVFEVLSWENQAFTDAGLLASRQSSTGAVYTVKTWDGWRSKVVQDESGLQITRGYDAMDRIISVTRPGVGSGLPDSRVALEYDAADHLRFTRQGAPDLFDGIAPGQLLMTERRYDDRGELTTIIQPASDGVANDTTAYDYPANTRDLHVIYHQGTAQSCERLVTRHSDGRTKSMTGSEVIPEYYTYDFEPVTNRPRVKINLATDTGRSRELVSDLLGRVVEEHSNGFVHPGGTSKPLYTYHHYNSRGQPDKTWTVEKDIALNTELPISANQVMEYDDFGMVKAAGLDLDTTAGLNPEHTDRYRTFTYAFAKDSSNIWWSTVTTRSYHTDEVQGTNQASIQARLPGASGFPGGMLGQTNSYDYYNNPTIQVTGYGTNTHTVTTTSLDGTKSVQTSIAGLVTSAQVYDDTTSGAVRLQTLYSYDALGRQIGALDARTGQMQMQYKPNTTRLWITKDGNSMPIATNAYDAAGRLASTLDGNSNETDYTYWPTGQVKQVSGTAAHPEQYDYDAYGQLYKLRTYRNGLTGAFDETTWDYDPNTGWLAKKTDALGRIASYDYVNNAATTSPAAPANKQMIRTWARPVSTTTPTILLTSTYQYSLDTGELMKSFYNDGSTALPTATVTYKYNRDGSLHQVTDATGAHDFAYDHGQLSWEGLDVAWYNGLLLTPRYDDVTSTANNTVKGRYVGLTLGYATNGTTDLDKEMAVAYAYDDLGRMSGVTPTYKNAPNTWASPSIPFNYRYRDLSNLWDKLTQGPLTATNPSFSVTRDFDTYRDAVTSISTKRSGVDVASYTYGYDLAGRMNYATQTGAAFDDFGPASHVRYGYNNRDELTSATGRLGSDPSFGTTDPKLPGRDFGFSFDDAGNRKTASVDTESVSYKDTIDLGGALGGNKLNQPLSRGTLKTHVSGSATPGTTVTVGGVTANQPTGMKYWDAVLPLWSQYASLTVSATAPGATNASGSVLAITRPSTENFKYDEDGNLTRDSQWEYTYDAENRLIRVQTSSVISWSAPAVTLDFTYDYANRRVRKVVHNGNTLTSDRKFIYDGSRLLAEFDMVANRIARTYVWGLDLASSLDATGGVGGLLMEVFNDGTTLIPYTVASDAHGNVTALSNHLNGALAASYEYGPFGENLRTVVKTTEAIVVNQPFRFSTKFTDAETGLVDYGLRFYSPSMGRFINRDPIAEAGGSNLYAFVGNNPANHFDVMGMGLWDWLKSIFTSGDGGGAGPDDGGGDGGGLAPFYPFPGFWVDDGGKGEPPEEHSYEDSVNRLGRAQSDNDVRRRKVNSIDDSNGEIELATAPRKVRVFEEDGWSLRDIYRTLERTHTQEAQVFIDQLKQLTIVRMDGIDLKHTYPDGRIEIDHSPMENPDGTINFVAGGAVRSTNTIYIYKDLTVLAAVETAYHEAGMHIGRGAGEYDARAGAALFMERIGLGSQFPQFLQTKPAEAATPSDPKPPKPEVVANPEGIKATISRIYQASSTIEKVYGPKILQSAPTTPLPPGR